ncbi:MAG: hypothetical protein ABEJ03_03020 [Candidatus Nanohaloarchaea archaeon]
MTSVILTVLLLGVAVGLTSIYAGWAPNLSKEIAGSAANQTAQDTRCRNAGISVQNPEYDKNSNIFSFDLKNTGNIRFEESIEVAAFSNALRLNSTSIAGLSPGRTRPGSMKTGSKPDKVLVNAQECPGLTAPVAKIQVTQ